MGSPRKRDNKTEGPTMSDDDTNGTTPDFVRSLWGGDPVETPLELSPKQLEALRLEIEELDRARAVAHHTAQGYTVWR